MFCTSDELITIMLYKMKSNNISLLYISDTQIKSTYIQLASRLLKLIVVLLAKL